MMSRQIVVDGTIYEQRGDSFIAVGSSWPKFGGVRDLGLVNGFGGGGGAYYADGRLAPQEPRSAALDELGKLDGELMEEME
jgi:hypothetical protein